MTKIGEPIGKAESLMRFRMKPMKVKPDEFPDRIRASTIASYWWCGWKSYACAILGVTIPEKEWMSLGTKLHDKLFETLGKRFPWEEHFVKEIDKYRVDKIGFLRRYENTDIYVDITGHPDDFQVTPGGIVSLVEYKTTRMGEYLSSRFLLPIAKFQARLYPWVIEPTINGMVNEFDINYTIGGHHAVAVYSTREKEMLKRLYYTIVRHDEMTLSNDIMQIFNFYKQPEKIKPCVAWKCKYCSDIFHEICPHYKARKAAGVFDKKPKKRKTRKKKAAK